MNMSYGIDGQERLAVREPRLRGPRVLGLRHLDTFAPNLTECWSRDRA